MDSQQDASRVSLDSLALARKHVRALTDGGVSRQALLRALLEQEEANSEVPPLPSQGEPQQPKLKKSKSLSRALSQSQANKHPQHQSSSHWSVSTAAAPAHEEGDRLPNSDQLSTSTNNSGSRNSYLSTHTAATTLSSRSSTVTQFPGAELAGNRPTSASTRAYWCTSCDTEFKRKFDWKRHEDEFHERYKKYPCPDCNRVFWGANTFNQHHKTRHNCKTCPHADKVIKYTRKKRAWACGFCAAFLPSMDRYIDHIGLHYESGRTRAHWYHSNVIYGLLHQPGVNAAWKNIIGSRFSHIPKDQQPRYGWDAKTTGRKQGFLENETTGNLQDLLEFFNPTKDDPVKIARQAFDLAELTPANQVPTNRGSLDGPNKAPQPPPPPAPKRERSPGHALSKRKPSGHEHEPVPPPLPVEKQQQHHHHHHHHQHNRPVTQWPGYAGAEMPPDMPRPVAPLRSNDADAQMPDYDSTAVPPPLFAGTLSPPPQYAQQPPPHGMALSPGSDQPTFLTPTTPLPPTPSTPFPGGLPRDTVVDLLSDYMARGDHQHGMDTMDMDMALGGGGAGGPDALCQQQQPQPPQPPFGAYDDWNSICSTMVDDVASPRHNGPGPLPPAPHEDPHHHHQRAHQQQQQHQVRRSDFWAPADGPESMYIDNVQACDISSLPPPPSLRDHGDGGRRSDVWAQGPGGAVDYEGMGYEDEIAGPPPAANWL